MKVHKLKLEHKYYHSSEINAKTFEIRKNDRNFHVGDVLMLYDTAHPYMFHFKMITYILDDEQFLQPGYVCLGVVPVPFELVYARKEKDEVSEKEKENVDG